MLRSQYYVNLFQGHQHSKFETKQLLKSTRMNNEKMMAISQSVMSQFFYTTPNEAHLLQLNNHYFPDNSARTQNEQQLDTSYQKAEADEQNMKNIVFKLQDQIKAIKL